MYKTKLILFCGLPGSGKTTLGKKLEQEFGYIRLCPDEWMDSLGVDMFDEEFRDRLEKALWKYAESLLKNGHDVILENGLWTKGEREEKRRDAARLKVSTEMHFFNLSLEELKHRVARRNTNAKYGECPLTEADLDKYWQLFQKPSSQELAKFNTAFVYNAKADHR